MKKIKITMEMGDEVVTLSLNTNSTLTQVLEHITKIREEQTIEQLIEQELAIEMPDGEIYESPDGGRTIYKRKVGDSKRKLVSNRKFKSETRYDMGGSYDVITLSEPKLWQCEYCGEDTFDIDTEYLFNTNHLRCELKHQSQKNK